MLYGHTRTRSLKMLIDLEWVLSDFSSRAVQLFMSIAFRIEPTSAVDSKLRSSVEANLAVLVDNGKDSPGDGNDDSEEEPIGTLQFNQSRHAGRHAGM